MSSTVYDIRLRYQLEDRASKQLQELAKAAKEAESLAATMGPTTRRSAQSFTEGQEAMAKAARARGTAQEREQERLLREQERAEAKARANTEREQARQAKDAERQRVQEARAHEQWVEAKNKAEARVRAQAERERAKSFAQAAKEQAREQAQAAKEAQALERAMRGSASGASALVAELKRVTVLVGGGMLVGKAKSALIDFNSELEQSQIQIAGMMQLNIGGAFAENWGRATNLVSEFQQIAKSSVGTTKDFVDMAANITRPVLAAGGSMADLRDMTKSAVILAKAFGVNAEIAAFDIEQALSGTMTARDRLTRAVLAPMGFSAEEFNKLDASKRMETLRKAMNQQAITDMAGAQGESFAGVMSTLEDSIGMFLGKVGLPLFKEITAEIQRWNTYLDANSDQIGRIAKDLAGSLVDGFRFLKDVGTWFVENSGTIMAVAKGLVAFKAAQGLTSLGGSLVGGIGKAKDMFAALAQGGNGIRDIASAGGIASSNLVTFASKLSSAIPIIGGLAVAGSALYDMFRSAKNAEDRRRIEAEFLTGQLFERSGKVRDAQATVARLEEVQRGRGYDPTGRTQPMAGRALTPAEQLELERAKTAVDRGRNVREDADRQLAEWLMQKGALDRNLQLSDRQIMRLRDSEAISRENVGTFQSALIDFQNRAKAGQLDIARLLRPIQEEAPTTPADDQQDRSSTAQAPKVNVTIQRIEVQSDDPDRFVFQMVESFRDLAKSPGSALTAFKEG